MDEGAIGSSQGRVPAVDWLEGEASYLERTITRDYERLAQVRLEIQRSNGLATELDEMMACIEVQAAKLASELARRAARPEPIEPSRLVIAAEEPQLPTASAPKRSAQVESEQQPILVPASAGLPTAKETVPAVQRTQVKESPVQPVPLAKDCPASRENQKPAPQAANRPVTDSLRPALASSEPCKAQVHRASETENHLAETGDVGPARQPPTQPELSAQTSAAARNGADSGGSGFTIESIPTVTSIKFLKHEPAQSLDLRQEEKVYKMLARIASRKPALDKAQLPRGLNDSCAHHAFSAAEAASSGQASLRILLQCRDELVQECISGGLEPLDEHRLGFSPPASAVPSTLGTAVVPGYLEFLEAAASAGAVRIVKSIEPSEASTPTPVWLLQRGERVEGEAWRPLSVDVSLKFVLDLTELPYEQGERVQVEQVHFQIKMLEEAPLLRTVVQKSKKPPKETTDARGAQAYATAAMRRTFWLKARGLRHGRNQIFIRVGIQSRHKVQSGPSGPVVWGAWTSQPLVLLVSPDGTVSTITDKDKAAGGATVAAPRQQGPPPPASPPPAAAAQVRTRSEPILVN